MRHLGSIDDVTSADMLRILDRAEALRTGGAPRPHPGQVLTLAFFQPSMRTRLGFATAGIRAGFGLTSLNELRHDATMCAAESLADTIRVASAYADVMVLRHHAADAWQTAVANARCPLVNGGMGRGEHPTQALIDLFAIRRAAGRLEGLRVGVVGDVNGSRSAHSLLKGLARLSPEEIRLMGPPSRVDATAAATWATGATHHLRVRHALDLSDLDVVYVAGLPAGTGVEHLDDAARAQFALTPERMRGLPDTAVVLCPMPRIDEILPAVDRDHRARYFVQSDEAVFVRTAVLEKQAAA